MGYFASEGEKFEMRCRACGETVKIISTGSDICDCPYCGMTLMDHECDNKSLAISLDRVAKRIIKYKNTSGFEQGTYKLELKNALRWLLNDLEFHDENS